MKNSFVTTKKMSFLDNIKQSLIGTLVGIIFFCLSFVILWINEQNGAKLAQQEIYIKKNAITVTADKPNRDNDGKLIVTSEKLVTTESLADENLKVRNALVLDRLVEMYQWEEEKKEKTKESLGGSSVTTTTYAYSPVWSSRHIDSSKFNQTSYKNPDFPITSLRLNAPVSAFGGFVGTELQTNNIVTLSPITNLPPSSLYKIYDGKYYSKDADPSHPEVGDIRILYFYAPSGHTISLIGQQNSNNTISKHATKHGEIYWQEDGNHDKNKMLENIKKSNSLFTNIFRVVGFIFMFLGLSLLINPLSTILKFIPALGNIVGFVAVAIMFLVSVILSLTTICIAWFAYRPLHATGLVIIIGLVIYAIVEIVRKNNLKKAEVQINE